MTTQEQKFDALAEDYDRHRPRYPEDLLRRAAEAPTAPRPLHVVDTGAGTGIALEGLVPLLGEDAVIDAVDVSAGMVEAGRRKFPQVRWTVGEAEPFLEGADADVGLVLAAQAYQWMDRRRFLAAAGRCLVPGGCVAIVQNNRDFATSPFLDAYETLLEELSPGYSRSYRAFDIAAELRDAFPGGEVDVHHSRWEQPMTSEDFVGMVRSSTQAQRAIAAHGDAFLDRLRALLAEHDDDGDIAVAYASELFLARPR